MNKDVSKKTIVIVAIISIIVIGICITLIVINWHALNKSVDDNNKSADDLIEKWEDLENSIK